MPAIFEEYERRRLGQQISQNRQPFGTSGQVLRFNNDVFYWELPTRMPISEIIRSEVSITRQFLELEGTVNAEAFVANALSNRIANHMSDLILRSNAVTVTHDDWLDVNRYQVSVHVTI